MSENEGTEAEKEPGRDLKNVKREAWRVSFGGASLVGPDSCDERINSHVCSIHPPAPCNPLKLASNNAQRKKKQKLPTFNLQINKRKI